MSITACVAVTSVHWPKEPRMGFRHSGHVIKRTARPKKLDITNRAE